MSPFIHPLQENQFNISDWYPSFQSCLEHFVNKAQYTASVQAVASFVNIKLPHQLAQCPSRQSQTPPSNEAAGPAGNPLVPYVRRLVVTAFDSAAVFYSFFGDEWPCGIGPLHEMERQNYLFAVKSESWLTVKNYYDMADGQTVPFLRPLWNVSLMEIEAAESHWSNWLAMQDWMLGPRAPDLIGASGKLEL